MIGPTIYGPRQARAVIVGQALNRLTDGRPWAALVRHDLAQLCGLELADYLATFGRCDLIERYPGQGPGGGDLFPLAEAKDAARALLERLAGRRVVLLGRQVEAAFELEPVSAPWYAWRSVGRMALGQHLELATAPHPSRRSTYWNDEGNFAKARAFWTALAAWAGPCEWPGGLKADALENLERRREAQP